MRFTAFLFVFSCLISPTLAQDEPPAPTAPLDDSVLHSALEKLATAETAALSGRVKIEAGEGDGGLGVMIMGGRGGKSAAPWKGRIDVLRRGKESIVASRKALPGFAIWRSGDHVIVDSMREEEPMGLKELSSDLPPLIAFRRLARKARKTTWKAKLDDGGNTVFSGKFGADYVAKESDDDSPMAMGFDMTPRVIYVRVAVTVNLFGALMSFRFSVIRSDPMAALQEIAMESGGELRLDEEMLAEIHDIEGKTHVYSLDVVQKPTGRTEATLARIKKVQQ